MTVNHLNLWLDSTFILFDICIGQLGTDKHKSFLIWADINH